jgi:hypothetical protein
MSKQYDTPFWDPDTVNDAMPGAHPMLPKVVPRYRTALQPTIDGPDDAPGPVGSSVCVSSSLHAVLPARIAVASRLRTIDLDMARVLEVRTASSGEGRLGETTILTLTVGLRAIT